MLSVEFEPELEKIMRTWSAITPGKQCKQDIQMLIARYRHDSLQSLNRVYPVTKNKVKELLKLLKLPSKITGYHYLLTAIILAVEEPERLDYPYIDLFPAVARYHHVAYDILSAIRTALRQIIETPENKEFLDEQFLPYRSVNVTRPSLDLFVEIMAEYIRSDLPL